jgi:cytoskeletal protein RodZ
MEGPPNHPKLFGEELRRLRESAGLELDDIAVETKISKRILGDLEEGDFRFLPERVFCRNFVLQYAAVVGADPDRLGDAFDDAWQRFLLASGSHPRLVEPDELPRRRIHWRFWLPVGIGAAILLAAVSVILNGTREEVDLAPDPRRGLPIRPTSTAAPESRPRLATPTKPVEVPEGTDESSSVTVVVRVRPQMECWIRFRDRDGIAGERLLADGVAVHLELPAPVKLTVGNAGAVSLEVAGKTYDQLGGPGQVVHTEISTAGLAVLGPGAPDD